MYSLGGSHSGIFVFDFETERWSQVYHNLRYSGNHYGAVTVGTRIFLIGGFTQHSDGIVQIYDTLRGVWSVGPTLPWRAHGSVSAALLRGEIHACGGLWDDDLGRYNTNNNPEDCFRLNPTTLVWTRFSSMLRGVDHAASGADSDHFFIFGGRDSGRNRADPGINLCQKYTYDTNEWEACAPMPFGRAGTGRASYWGEHMIVLGGETMSPDSWSDSFGVYPQVATYSIPENSWSLTELEDMPRGRHGMDSVIFDQSLWIAGGSDRFQSAPTNWFSSLCLPYFRASTPPAVTDVPATRAPSPPIPIIEARSIAFGSPEVVGILPHPSSEAQGLGFENRLFYFGTRCKVANVLAALSKRNCPLCIIFDSTYADSNPSLRWSRMLQVGSH